MGIRKNGPAGALRFLPGGMIILLAVLGRGALTGHAFEWRKSDVAVMFDEPDFLKRHRYSVDLVTWGNQLHPHPGAMKTRKDLFHSYWNSGIRLYSLDLALIQEGGLYLMCDGNWSPECHQRYWDLYKKKGDLNVKTFQNRAVTGHDGILQGLPRLDAEGKTIPMACVHDPGYKAWLTDKIDWLLEAKPTALHLDEPLMEGILLNHKKACFSSYAMDDFNAYLNARRDMLDALGFNGAGPFDTRSFLNEKKVRMPEHAVLWSIYETFELEACHTLFNELVAHARKKAGDGLLVSANMSPVDWKAQPLIGTVDFLSTEITHEPGNGKMSCAPILRYKCAEASGKPMFATALGRDWGFIKKNNHDTLACAWIAQAYAFGQAMAIPVRAWIPNDSYVPSTDVVSELAQWITRHRDLIDGFETISTVALPVRISSLRNPSVEKRLIGLVERLVGQGVLFDVVWVGDDGRPLNARRPLDSYLTVLACVRECPPADMTFGLSDFSENMHSVNIIEPNAFNAPLPSERKVTVAGESGVFCIPRIKPRTKKLAVHLLNRDYRADARAMNKKKDLVVRLSTSLFSGMASPRAIFHSFATGKGARDAQATLTIKQAGEWYELTVPVLDVWGIVECFDGIDNRRVTDLAQP